MSNSSLSAFEVNEHNVVFKQIDGVLFNHTDQLSNKSPTYSIPIGTTSIGEHAFSGTRYLQVIYIPESVISFEQQAFSNCGSLEVITIPESVKSIGEDVFTGCTNLKEIK